MLQISKRLIVLLTAATFFVGPTYTFAVTWYDTLPASGEVAPKADMEGVRPNYSGSIDFQSEELSGTTQQPEITPPSAPEDSQVTQENIPGDESIPPSKNSWLWVAVIVIVIMLTSGLVVYRNSRKR